MPKMGVYLLTKLNKNVIYKLPKPSKNAKYKTYVCFLILSTAFTGRCNKIRPESTQYYTLQKQVGCFNRRVVTLVAGKLERHWL